MEKNKLKLEHLQLTQWEAYSLPQEFTFAEAIQAVLTQVRKEGCDQFLSKTSLMIKPGYRIKSVQGIITNFHQPGSTLLLLVSAGIGPQWKEVYQHALSNEYRFLSYGDSSLLYFN